MVSFGRKKRVTDPFDDHARARLVGADHRQLSSDTSGSQHSGDDDFLSLSDLVHGFLEDNSNDADENSAINELDSDRVDSVDECVDSVEESLKLRNVSVDPYRNTILAHVSEAAENFAFLKERNVLLYLRSVVAFLKERGHDAAICETAWESSLSGGGVTAGSHVFIDVVKLGSSTWRYLIDHDFRAQFEIARPTWQFKELLSSVPGIFVGGEEELKRTVSMVCNAAKRCFRSRGLPVPPWRKNRFMQNKWFGPSRRTANPVRTPVTALNGVSCRLVGFNGVVTETRRAGSVVVRTRC